MTYSLATYDIRWTVTEKSRLYKPTVQNCHEFFRKYQVSPSKVTQYFAEACFEGNDELANKILPWAYKGHNCVVMIDLYGKKIEYDVLK